MIADKDVRARALDPARSFIVQAPAGSGKTELLVRRYLALLARSKKPEEILAITFTIKAAAEMRERIIRELQKTPLPGLAVAELSHRLRIQTIDAFCLSLTRQVPVLSRFGAQPRMLLDASALYREAAERTLARFDHPGVARLLAYLDNDVGSATVQLAAMLERRDQWLRRTDSPPTREELESVLAVERKRLLDRAQALHPGATEEFSRSVLTKEGEWRKSKAGQEFAGNEPLRLALKGLLSMPPAHYTEPQWQALESMLALLPEAAQMLRAIFAIENQADFPEVVQGAVQALGAVDDPTDLLLKLDASISHILVDEFQDTSVSQWELLERLTAGWQRDEEDSGSDRTLFLVGDPMQSIYRFRQAEVSLFLRARREGLPNVRLEPLTLSTNFRSQEKLVSWFNAAFPRVLPAAADEAAGAVPYAPSSPARAALAGEGAQWHLFWQEANQPRDQETRRVVEIARSAGERVAILVRTRDHLAEIVPALKAAGLRFRAVEIEQLGERQIVQDLYALTRALMHRADRVAWLALLRAPWVGLTLPELLFFEDKEKLVWDLIQAEPRLERFRSVLAPALGQHLRGTLRDRVEGVWLALGGPACAENATDLEDAAAYLDTLEKLEHAGTIEDLDELEARLDKLFAIPDVEAGEDAIEVMTIHKAKGLQWPTVIVPGLDRPPRSSGRDLVIWKQTADPSSPRLDPSSPRTRGPRFTGGSLLLAPINETGSEKDPLYEYVRARDKESDDLEGGRLFYVAATRAQNRLHLLGCVKQDDDGGARLPPRNSLLAKAWSDAGRHLPPAPAAAAAPAGQLALELPKPDTVRRLVRTWQLPAAPAPVKWTAPPEGREEQQIEFSWAGENARHVGTVVHRWLQRIAEDALQGWDARRVDSLRQHFERELYRRGVDNAGAAALLVTEALNNSISDERGRWILGPHPESRTEYRIRTPQGRLVIDRLIREANGTRWVVDYKTGRREGANVESFLDAEQLRYAAQLDAYAQALGGASRGLYFPLHRGWRNW
jgi:ATP-dependent helicase/nuclease subunit A